ncbi:hypothetical protein SAMN05442782_2446 [Streptomyces sp. OK228]|nr:hypothetical protein SAMN05442782_2446 [Streptomyces sp. OK228]
MPIHLRAPSHDPNGPDGQGWNRLSLGSLAGDECALRPLDYGALLEVHGGTHRASYGGYGPCTAQGNCETCPVFQAGPRALTAPGHRVLVRVDPGGHPHLMARPDDGWSSASLPCMWQDLARLNGWAIGSRHRDQYGDGFWLTKVQGA